jgi:hypothetical protein
MDQMTLARAAEPFFTTKGVGRGTGLGLATARGFAEQSGGRLHIDSTLNVGTTVSLWLPEAGPEELADRRRCGRGNVHETPHRVLLVDDDALVRESIAAQLEELGYTITAASSAEEALSFLRSGKKSIAS